MAQKYLKIETNSSTATSTKELTTAGETELFRKQIKKKRIPNFEPFRTAFISCSRTLLFFFSSAKTHNNQWGVELIDGWTPIPLNRVSQASLRVPFLHDPRSHSNYSGEDSYL
ncbi:hypothetical protein CDAR_235951 [Caerostris darwini]|uniref:Ycf15 n=1 Tax=Caerostris darwini TaxID=1538125 RepID=A0AAV4UG01_9ARAC|nr:hypothetical protein CDAR_235951 [Caerostris darwini]